MTTPAGSEPPGSVPLRLHGMFRCQICLCVVPPRTPARRLVLETRPRYYPFRPEVNRVVRISENGKVKEVYVDDPGGAGREVAREVVVCPACAARHDGR